MRSIGFESHPVLLITAADCGVGFEHDEIGLIASLFLCSGNAFAQTGDKEPAAVVELGGAGSWNLKDGGSSFGADRRG